MTTSIENLIDIVKGGKMEIGIELPSTDACRLIRNVDELYKFIAEFGRPLVERIGQTNYYRVPSFARGRAEYIAAKAKDCAIWGSN